MALDCLIVELIWFQFVDVSLQQPTRALGGSLMSDSLASFGKQSAGLRLEEAAIKAEH